MKYRWIPIGCAVGAFVIYLVTLSPSVDFIDSGELSTVVATLGIAHPTGYPLYTILGHLFTALPLHSIAWRTNLFSAMWSSFTVGLVAWVVIGLIKQTLIFKEDPPFVSPYNSRGERKAIPHFNSPPHSRGEVKQGLMNQTIVITTSIVAAGYLALSSIHWEQAVTTEVYPLTVFLVTLLIGGLIHWFPKGDNGQNRCWVFLWCYLWGLGFGNHMMIVFLAPVALITVVLYRNNYRNPFQTFIIGGLFFLIGLTICLYLPIRSSLNPFMNWGDPQTLERLWNHLTAKQYRIWMFSQGFEPLMRKFIGSIGNLWHWISPPGALLAIVGFVFSWLDRPKVNAILLTLFLSVLVYSLNYDIPDIDPYYLPAHVVVAIWAGLGAFSILQILTLRGKTALSLASLVLIGTLIYPIIQHWKECDHHGDVLAESLGKGALESIPRGALVLNGFWDLQSVGLYLQHIEGYRNDVTMIDALLMERSWYVRQQMKQYPEVFQGLEKETANFLNVVADFEANRSYDANQIENCFIALMNGIIEKNLKVRRVLVGFLEMNHHPGLAKGFDKIPREVYFEIDRRNPSDTEPPLALDIESLAHPEWVRSKRTQWFMDQLVHQTMLRAQYVAEQGNIESALESVNRALRLKPNDSLIMQIREQLINKLSKTRP
jgi:hypothetical protein